MQYVKEYPAGIYYIITVLLLFSYQTNTKQKHSQVHSIVTMKSIYYTLYSIVARVTVPSILIPTIDLSY